MVKNAFYFSHDSNARNDLKCIRLRREMGMAGYGLYWCIIEMLRDESSNVLSMTYIDDIAMHLGVKAEDVKSVITKYDLFKVEKNNFYSKRLSESMVSFNSLKDRLSEAGRKGGLSRAKAGLEAGLNHPSSIKEKKRKENKRKGGVGEKTKGSKFDATKTFVIFTDGTKQKLGTNQIQSLAEGKLQPTEITKGIIY